MQILHGRKDMRTPLTHAQQFVDDSCAQDKELEVFEEGFHMLLQDQADIQVQAMGLVVEWLQARA